MHNETISCEKAVTAGDVKILPVVRLSLTCFDIKGSITFHAVKQPEYIVVCRDGRAALFNMTGEQIPMSRARAECPALDAALADYCDFQLPYDC